MSNKILVGLDGLGSGERALAYGKNLAKLMGDSELVLVYVIEWSPYSFQTPQENEERHKRREAEIKQANERIMQPAVKNTEDEGFKVKGIVQHGDVAETLNSIAEEEKVSNIVVGRSSEGGFAKRIFGSASSNLVQSASLPVTVVS